MEEEELCYGDSLMTMFENWPYALMGISASRGLFWVKINDLGDSIVL